MLRPRHLAGDEGHRLAVPQRRRSTAGGPTLTVLYTFPDEAHGQNPQTPFVSDSKGNLFGTAQSGGEYNEGALFELSPSAGHYKETVLFNFVAPSKLGWNPGPIAADTEGNLWGETPNGIFELTKTTHGWRAKLVYSCQAITQGGNDSRVTVVGTTVYAGCGSSSTVIRPTKSASCYTEKTLYDFNSQGYGYVTNGGLIVDGSGNVFGTAWTSVTNYPTSGPTFDLVKSSSGYKYLGGR